MGRSLAWARRLDRIITEPLRCGRDTVTLEVARRRAHNKRVFVSCRNLPAALLPLGLGLVLGVAGCAGPSGSGRRSSPSLTTIALPERPAIVEAQPLPAIPERALIAASPHVPTPPASSTSAPPLVIATNQSPPSSLTGNPWPLTWTNVWVPIETWARFNGLEGMAQLATGPEALFSLSAPNGPIRLKVGTPTTHANGHDALLGYSPRIIGGVPYVHSLDLEKTLQPLLSCAFHCPVSNRVVVVDPGHGGRDSGTRNGFGAENEKHFTLDWAWRLEAILAAAGWKVILTRTNDADIPLAERVLIAERAGADIFLSLHFNSGAQNPDMNGIETYCLTPTGLPSSLRRDFDDDPREVLPNNAHDRENLLLASRLHHALLDATGASDRGVRRARFMTVLRGQHRPAVLIEGGYLSNPNESRRIANPAYRQTLAEAVARALSITNLPVVDASSTAEATPSASPTGSSP
jgi:N-acetylmuramoyl-L-alanine amidase